MFPFAQEGPSLRPQAGQSKVIRLPCRGNEQAEGSRRQFLSPERRKAQSEMSVAVARARPRIGSVHRNDGPVSQERGRGGLALLVG